jgi:hypothetical protein
MIIVAVFLDLKRAFETIDRNILMQKLFCYGITEDEYNWFKSYLDERFQKTGFDGVMSAIKKVELGVPQGSVLGPLLFVLYINDIVLAVQHSTVNLFADDTLLSVVGGDAEECLNKMNEDLASLTRWLNFNKLKLNIEKTKYMIITSRRIEAPNTTSLLINGSPIERVQCMKYLGVKIDEKLNFKEHLTMITKKMSSKAGFLGRISKKLTKKTKLMIYNSVIQPHIDFCSTILFMATEEEMGELQKIQNRVMRIVLKKPARTKIKWMLDALDMLSVKQRVYLNTLVLVFKMKNNMLPEYMSDEIIYNRQATARVLRNADDFRLPKYNKSCTQNTMWYDGLKLFNQLATETKNITVLENFKKEVVPWLKTKFPVV